MWLITPLICTGLTLSLLLGSVTARLERRHSIVHANRDHAVSKRYDGSRFSWYHVTAGEVACGGWYQDADSVVALTSQQWDGGAHCGKQITMSWGGKTKTATIVDECMECPYAGLDLTISMFDYFGGSTDPGYLWEGTWDYIDAAPTTTSTTVSTTSTPPPPPPTTTTSTHTTTSSTSTWVPPSTTSTSTTTHTTTSSTSSTSSTHSSSSSTSSIPSSTSTSTSTSTSSPSSSATTSSSVASSTSSTAPSSTSAAAAATPSSVLHDLMAGYAQLAVLNAAAMNGA